MRGAILFVAVIVAASAFANLSTYIVGGTTYTNGTNGGVWINASSHYVANMTYIAGNVGIPASTSSSKKSVR